MARNPLIRKIPNTTKSHNTGHKSPGILDDHAVRKTINSKEMYADYLEFNINYEDGNKEGRLQWNMEDGTLEVGMSGGVVNLQIGQEMLIKTKNTSGVNISNGQPVRVTGGTGNNATIELSNATDFLSGSIGLATEDIDNNQFGFVTIFGLVRDIDTSSWTDGTAIFLGNTDGAKTNIPPTGITRKVFLGVVIRQHASEGIILVNPINVSSIDELSSVIYGSMYNDNNDTTVTIASAMTMVRIPSGFTVGQANNTTFQNSREFVIEKDGKYRIDWSISFSSDTGVNQDTEGAIMVNNVRNAQSTAHRKIASANDLGNMGATCILDLSVNDVVSLGLQNNTSTANFTVNHANLSLTQAG